MASSPGGSGSIIGWAAIERIHSMAEGDDAPATHRRLRAFEAIFVLVVAVEYWLRAIPKWGQLGTHYYALATIASIACVAILADRLRLRRPAFAMLAVGHAALVWSEFPSTGNHAYLEVYVCLLAAFLSLDVPEEAEIYLRSLRWLGVIVLFYSGLQKLVWGHYFGGEYLTFSLGGATYRPVVGLLLTPDELARLTRLTGEIGDGPYRAQSWALLAVSNATWLAELALAPALCWRRTRTLAVIATLLLVAAIEAAAREVFFGLVFANLILLFTRRDRHTAALPVVALLLALLALSRLGILPEITFY